MTLWLSFFTTLLLFYIQGFSLGSTPTTTSGQRSNFNPVARPMPPTAEQPTEKSPNMLDPSTENLQPQVGSFGTLNRASPVSLAGSSSKPPSRGLLLCSSEGDRSEGSPQSGALQDSESIASKKQVGTVQWPYTCKCTVTEDFACTVSCESCYSISARFFFKSWCFFFFA